MLQDNYRITRNWKDSPYFVHEGDDRSWSGGCILLGNGKIINGKIPYSQKVIGTFYIIFSQMDLKMLKLASINNNIIILSLILSSCGNKTTNEKKDFSKTKMQSTSINQIEVDETLLLNNIIDDSCQYWIKYTKEKFPDTYPKIRDKYSTPDTIYSQTVVHTTDKYEKDFNIYEKSSSCKIDKIYVEKIVRICLTTDTQALKSINELIMDFKRVVLNVCLKNVNLLSEVLESKSEDDIYRFWYYYYYHLHPDNYYKISDPEH